MPANSQEIDKRLGKFEPRLPKDYENLDVEYRFVKHIICNLTK